MSQQTNESAKRNTLEVENKEFMQTALSFLNLLGVLLTIYALYWGFKSQVFTSEAALTEWLAGMGAAAPYGFIFIQIIQTVLPIIPGALTIPMGALVFGMKYGFFLNFIGIMIGSIMNFALARKFGRPWVELIADKKKLGRYTAWLDDGSRFEKLFTFGMFFPFSPADLLCYLAGLSNISFQKYLWRLAAGKPFTLLVYSYGTVSLLSSFFHFLR